MKALLVIVMALVLSGCASAKQHWDQLSEGEKVALAVSTAIVVGAVIIKNSQGDTVVVNNCASLLSRRTGCEDFINRP